MNRWRIWLIGAALLTTLSQASAQERVWNAALDRYEYVCQRCAQWRDRIDAGQTVPRDSLRIMMKELSGVRSNLQYALGEMSPGQRRRFEAIREHYATGKWPEEKTERIEAGGDFSASLEMTGRAQIPGTSPGMTDGAWMSTGAAARKGNGMVSGTGTALQGKHHRHRPGLHPVAGVLAGVYPDFSYGIFAGVTVNQWGFWLKGRSNFHTRKTAYDCLSDGTTHEGYFWSGNGRTVNRHQITLDVSYAFWKPVSIYLGAGYGKRTLCWKDSDGEWARVTDRSWEGLALDAGLLIHPIRKGPARGLSFLIGGSWLPKQYLDVEIGLAWQF